METDPLFAISLAVVVAAIYLVILRLIDPNEREPLWALGLVLFVGLVAGGIATAVVDSSFRVVSIVGAAATSEISKFVAIAVGLAALEGIGRLRGWSEFNGVLDGIVYGAAAGLGFAVGETLVRELVVGAGATAGTSPLGVLWTTLLFGLREGIFGAIIGAAFGAALVRRAGGVRLLIPLLGLVVAFGISLLYILLDDGADRLSGSLLGTLVALLLPLVLIALLAVRALARERRAITEELADEARGGVVTEDELRLLSNPAARRSRSLSRLAKGDAEGWLATRSLHNRQVQLALAERRSRTESDPEQRQEIDAEVARLRASILEMKARLEAPRGSATEGRPA